jgi:nucleotide-binding universal stress UspA family protein
MGGEGERRVIVGIQDSVAGLQALRRGIEEACRRGATLYAVRAVDGGAGRYPGAAMWQAELTVWAAELARETLVKALGGIPPGIEVRAVAFEAAAGPGLVGFADRDDDLLVVGDAQRSGIRRLWSGRVARYCIARATCPVLVVPPPALARLDSRVLTRDLRRLVNSA